MRNNKNLIPLVYIGAMYFTVGFTMGINSYLLPFLQLALAVSAGESYLILAATFSAFLLFGYPSSLLIKKIGYKKTMATAFAIYAAGFMMFIPSAKCCSLNLFLLASFLCGTGNAILQAAINPYVTILGPIESAAKRMSMMGICNAFAWPTAPIVLALVIGKNIEDTTLVDITHPFLLISIVSLILSGVMLFAPLKEIKAKGEEEANWGDCPYAEHKKSIWQFPHLLIGCLALFLYVGVETVTSATIVDYATNIGLSNPDHYAIYPSIGMVTGYICGILLIPQFVTQKTALKICAYIALVGTLLVVFTPPEISIVCVTIISLGCSLMYPSLWPLAIVDLGRFTKTGSSLLVTSIVGGAVIPTCFGFLKDSVGNQNAYWLCLPSFLFILFYAYWGYKIRVQT